MRRAILGFNQELCLPFDLDMSDILILSYVKNSQDSAEMTHLNTSNYVWLSHKKIIEDLPILKWKEDTLRHRLGELKKKGLIHSLCITNSLTKGSMTYYCLTPIGEGLFYGVD